MAEQGGATRLKGVFQPCRTFKMPSFYMPVRINPRSPESASKQGHNVHGKARD